MEIIRSITELKQVISTIKNDQQTIGFVPTMGFLHEGHLALVEAARAETDQVILSIFVNPLQFGENEDFDQYPRNEANDLQLARKHGVDYVFIPEVNEMYPESIGVSMTVTQRIGVLCDRSRPGHFSGVLTVLTKLFHLVQSDFAYFGNKDAQQIAIVDLLITDLNFPIKLRMIPTVREDDGLAKSSRNVNLSDSERKEAPALYQALVHGKQVMIDGERSADKIEEEISRFLNERTSGKVDYVELLSFPNLEPIRATDHQVIIALAVQFKKARLIDNIIFNI
ncbi:pantoate--beta-alanine ligase [Amphibacillus indicireducens]|uniref:Pantothenate synthetase n=1 Tax=Amphibacillus indicireducens TaxID=1076330 RepID=A0ABP7VQ96_9BACI